jgi:hypothetical protein
MRNQRRVTGDGVCLPAGARRNFLRNQAIVALSGWGQVMSDIELISPLPPEECESRLRAAIGRDGPLALFSSWPVVGRVSGRSVRLRKWVFHGNSFQTLLTGSFEEALGGAVFHGNAGMRPIVRTYMAVWFGGVVLGWAVCLACALAWPAGGGQLMALVVPPLMLAGGVAMVRVGRWLARGEEQFLVAFMEEVIEARTPLDAGSSFSQPPPSAATAIQTPPPRALPSRHQ